MKFNEKLIKLRKASGLSQEELGNKLNVARQTVSKCELGETTPEMDKLEELSNLFEVSIDELVKDSSIPNIITKEMNQEKIDSLYKDFGTAKKGNQNLFNNYWRVLFTVYNNTFNYLFHKNCIIITIQQMII